MHKIYRLLYRFFIGVMLFVVMLESSRAETSTVDSGSDTFNRVYQEFSTRVEKYTLSNGLRVLFYPRRTAPVFAAEIHVRVGGVDEKRGKTGAAHMLEHMAFKGTTTIGTKDYAREKLLLEQIEQLAFEVEPRKNVTTDPQFQALTAELKEIWIENAYSRLYKELGASNFNAATSKDTTTYNISLPSEAFETWCQTESDRFANPVFRQFYQEREVVMEERRMRFGNNPGGQLYEALLATAYRVHPYGLPVIGLKQDIQYLKASDVAQLFSTYYRPDNMVIALAGDLDFAQVKTLIEKYFGAMKNPPTPLPQINQPEPRQLAERRVNVPFDAEPQVIIAYHKPKFPTADDGYFTLLHELLGGNRTSFFHRELVERKQIALSVGTGEAPGNLFPPIFYVEARPRPGISLDRLVNEIQNLLEILKREVITNDSLNRAKRQVAVNLLGSLTSNEGIAYRLASSEVLWGRWQEEFEYYQQIFAAKPENIQEIAEKYFTISNRTVGKIIPQQKSKSE